MPKIVLRDKWKLSRTYELHEPITMHNGDTGHVFHLEYVQCGEQGEYQCVHAHMKEGSVNREMLDELHQAMDVASKYINVVAQDAPKVWWVKGLATAAQRILEEEAKSDQV